MLYDEMKDERDLNITYSWHLLFVAFCETAKEGTSCQSP